MDCHGSGGVDGQDRFSLIIKTLPMQSLYSLFLHEEQEMFLPFLPCPQFILLY
jgi:hypothetical protein